MAKQKFERENCEDNCFRHMVFCYLLLSVMSILIFTNCGSDKGESRAGYLAGTVTDSITDMPLVGAWLGADSSFDSNDKLTDSLGEFSIAGFPSSGDLFCGHDGYRTQMKDYQIISDETTFVNFRLEPFLALPLVARSCEAY
jgi:hypothetical protein